MDYKYKIKRLIKSGERNPNGVIFEKDSTDKALKEYINRSGSLLLALNDPENYTLNDITICKPDEEVAKIVDFDDEYIYITEIYDRFDIVKESILQSYCQLCILGKNKNKIEEYTIIIETDKVLQIRLCDNKTQEISVIK